MEQIKKFLHGKGFALLLTASLLAAAAAGVWAVRALRAELQKSLEGLNAPGTTQQTTPETEPNWDAQEDTTWQQPVTDVANSKADVPQQTPSGASSGAQSGSGSLREPSALQGASSPAEGNWGTVVVLEDAAGRSWRLCGVADPDVKAGDTVTAGQKIGAVGTVGCECAEESHIHVEVKQGESYLDPAKLPE